MGGSINEPYSELRLNLIDEFIRCGENPKNMEINIKQLMEASKFFKYDITHMPLLFLIDERKCGLFRISDIFNLINYQNLLDFRDTTRAIKAFATLQVKEQQQQFVVWFGKLISSIEGECTNNNIKCVNESVVGVAYDLLNIQVTKLPLDDLILNMRQAGKQLGLEVDNGFVPVLILQNFANSICVGIKQLYDQIVAGINEVTFTPKFAADDPDIKEFYEIRRKAYLEKLVQEESD